MRIADALWDVRSFAEELETLDRASLRRSLRTLAAPQAVAMSTAEGKPLINFSSNDYLGLAAHPLVREALVRGVEKFGAGSGASRLVCGTLSPHTELEETLAAFKGTEAALTFSSGYAAAVGTISGLVTKGDVVILDKLAHASLVDGARLSGATLRIFAHNHLAQLERRLRWAVEKAGAAGRILVVTEGIFSMDGDRAPLREISALTRRHNALLLVDEAHSFGLCGRDGRGLAEELGVTTGVDLHLGTLSKAVGLAGGYVCGSPAAIELILNRARSLIYSTAPPPALAAAATFVLREIFPASPGAQLREMLWQNVRRCRQQLTGNDEPPTPESAIIPLALGSEESALAAAAALRAAGFLVPAIRYPSVARGQARLRLTLSASHTPEQIDALALHARALPG